MARHRAHDPVFVTDGGDEFVQSTRDGNVRIAGFEVDDDTLDVLIPVTRIPDLIRALVEAYRA